MLGSSDPGMGALDGGVYTTFEGRATAWTSPTESIAFAVARGGRESGSGDREGRGSEGVPCLSSCWTWTASVTSVRGRSGGTA